MSEPFTVRLAELLGPYAPEPPRVFTPPFTRSGHRWIWRRRAPRREKSDRWSPRASEPYRGKRFAWRRGIDYLRAAQLAAAAAMYGAAAGPCPQFESDPASPCARYVHSLRVEAGIHSLMARAQSLVAAATPVLMRVRKSWR